MNKEEEEDHETVETLQTLNEPTLSCWNPNLRRIMGSVATLGFAETAFLTFEKYAGHLSNLCGTDGSCESVLTGPYATLPNGIPISALGSVAYGVVAVLALAPLVNKTEENDSFNRLALLTLTTAMGTFSTFLVSLLFGVLHTSCPYCLASASFSWTLAACAWFGGCLPTENPEESKSGIQYSLASFAATTLAAVLLFVSVNDTSNASSSSSFMATTTYAGTNPAVATNGKPQQTLLASTATKPPAEGLRPPPIESTSSQRALTLSNDLSLLNAKMYGAYWCSHCFDQKTALGKEGFSKIQYVECDKDGYHSQTPICKARDVPGYPTWDIDGELYPGEMGLDELEDIVRDAMTK